MHTITLQDIFDAAWQAFVVEMKPKSENVNSNTCLYRSPEGHKCAIGLCIPDELYNEKFEGDAPGSGAFSTSGIWFQEPDTCADLQYELHDSLPLDFMSQEERAEHYRSVAHRFDLNIPTTENN